MGFEGELISKKVGPYLRELQQPFTYTTVRGVKYTVPERFVADGASIPRIFWSLIGSPFTGRYPMPAWLHDYLYRTQPIKRSLVDKIFLEGMAEKKVSWWKRRIMWFAVRSFGWIPWNKRKKKLEKNVD